MHSVDAELPGAIWPPLRRALLDMVALHASWGEELEGEERLQKQQLEAQGEQPRRAVVRFHQADGSHMAPPAWGRDPPPESEEAQRRLDIAGRLADAVRSQTEWLRLHGTPELQARLAVPGAPAAKANGRSRRRSTAPGAAAAAAAASQPLSDLLSGDVAKATAIGHATEAGANGASSSSSPVLQPAAAALIGSLRSALFSARAEAEALLLSASFQSGGGSPGAAELLSAAFPRSRGSDGKKKGRDSIGAGGGAGSGSKPKRLGRPSAAPYTDRERARARAAAALLDGQLSGLAQGEPMMRPLLSSLLYSLIRQQLRRTLEQDRHRNKALLSGLPRGRGVGFLSKCDSSAKVLSCALYEARSLRPMLAEPSLRALLEADERDARDVLAELPQPFLDDLLTLHEAHAALRHLLCNGGAGGATHGREPVQDEPGWQALCKLLAMARLSGCADEAHFFPLEELSSLRAFLLAQQSLVPGLARMLSFQSPQHPLNQRTRAKASSQPSAYGAEAASALYEAASAALSPSAAAASHATSTTIG